MRDKKDIFLPKKTYKILKVHYKTLYNRTEKCDIETIRTP